MFIIHQTCVNCIPHASPSLTSISSPSVSTPSSTSKTHTPNLTSLSVLDPDVDAAFFFFFFFFFLAARLVGS